MAFLKTNGNRQAILTETGGGNTASCETEYVFLLLACRHGQLVFRLAWISNLPTSEPTMTRSLDSQYGQRARLIPATSFQLLLTQMVRTNLCGPKPVRHRGESAYHMSWVLFFYKVMPYLSWKLCIRNNMYTPEDSSMSRTTPVDEGSMNLIYWLCPHYPNVSQRCGVARHQTYRTYIYMPLREEMSGYGPQTPAKYPHQPHAITNNKSQALIVRTLSDRYFHGPWCRDKFVSTVYSIHQ